jgi:hypothetical protein
MPWERSAGCRSGAAVPGCPGHRQRCCGPKDRLRSATRHWAVGEESSTRAGEWCTRFLWRACHTRASLERVGFSLLPLSGPCGSHGRLVSNGMFCRSLCNWSVGPWWPCEPCLSRTFWAFGNRGPLTSGLANLRRATTPTFVVPDGGRAHQCLVNAKPGRCCDRTFELILCRPPSRLVKLPSRNAALVLFLRLARP